MSRLNQILGAALVVQIILGLVVFWLPRVTAAETVTGPLLTDFKAAEVTELTINDGEGNQTRLAKSGDNWVLAEAGDYPANGTNVTALLEKLEQVQSNRLVTQTEASHGRLKVAADDFERLLEVKLADGTTHKLYLGSSAGASATHVRADDRPEVYLTGNITSWDANAQASNWIDTLYFTVPQTATVALTLENDNGTFEFVKEGETWSMEGLAEDETFNENNFTSLFSQASGIRMISPIGKEEQDSFGLDEPLATLTLTTTEGDQEKTHTLRIGAKNADDNSYVASSSDSPYYVRIAETTANNFINKTRDDFLQLPPTPTTEPGADPAEPQ